MDPDKKLKAYQVQIIEVPEGVLLVRGNAEFKISGKGAVETVKLVLSAGFQKGGATRREILNLFSTDDRAAVETLIDQLLERRFLTSGDGVPDAGTVQENPLDVFYWNFGLHSGIQVQDLNRKKLVLIGVNHISRRIASSFTAMGVTGYEVVDFNLLKNLWFYNDDLSLRRDQWPAPLNSPIPYEDWSARMDAEKLDCLIATSDFGGKHFMRDWNRFCVTNKVLFLPVVLDKMVGYVGPLVAPGESACYECLRARENSNMENPEVLRTSEYHAFKGQVVAGFHPSMASVLGDLTAVELTKFFSIPLQMKVGTLTTVNLLQPELANRKVLKAPRCPVCGPLARKASPTPLKEVFLPYQDVKLYKNE